VNLPIYKHLFLLLFVADKTGAKMIDDWHCPSSSRRIAVSTRRVHDALGGHDGHVTNNHVLGGRNSVGGDSSHGDDGDDDPVVVRGPDTILRTVNGRTKVRAGGEDLNGGRDGVGNKSLPLHHILLTLASLVSLLLVTGIASYCGAMRS